eukprot:16081673-Heterocapsa_arctica.AAC.1
MGSSAEGREDARGPGDDRLLVQDEVGERSEDGNCGRQAPRGREASVQTLNVCGEASPIGSRGPQRMALLRSLMLRGRTWACPP